MTMAMTIPTEKWSWSLSIAIVKQCKKQKIKVLKIMFPVKH